MLSFFKYLVIGSIVGVTAVLIREVFAMLLPEDSPIYYALSVFIVYVCAVVVSYVGHRKISFSHVDMEGRGTTDSMKAFAAIAVFGLLCTTLLSVCIRYFSPVTDIFGAFDGAVSLAIAALTTAVFTFFLNARLRRWGGAKARKS